MYLKSKIFGLAFILLTLSAISFSQAPTPSPTPDPEAIESNVGIYAETYTRVLKLTAGGNATEAGLRIPILPRWSLIASTIMTPAANGGFTFGKIEYRERADHVPFLKGNKGWLIPWNAVQFHGDFGLGQRRADGKKSEFAYIFEGGLSIGVATVGSAGRIVIEPGLGYIGSGPLNAPTSHFKFGGSGLAEIGVALKFGK